MDDNALIFMDSAGRLCGWLVGMTDEEVASYCMKYGCHVDTYKNFLRGLENADD